jgi:nitroreductase
MKVKNILRLFWLYGALLFNVFYDLNRYFFNSASNARRMNDDQLKARLLQKGHSIEKGLALPVVRPGFGAVPLKELYDLLHMYEERDLPRDDVAYLSARNAISSYISFHQERGGDVPQELAFVHGLALSSHDPSVGGYVTLKADDIRQAAIGDFNSLVHARHSTRMFASTKPDLRHIEEAIRIAGRSPSVCNRQGGRVRLVSDKTLLTNILTLQGGNRGFTDEIPVVMVVTCYIGLFRGARERNQCWIDGGLFAMSLLYALAYKGLGACPLNWSANYKQDMKLRRLIDIPSDEAVIMLVAVGNLRDEYRVASSARVPYSSVLARIYS